MNKRNSRISSNSHNDAIQAQRKLFKPFEIQKVKNYRINLALRLKESLNDLQDSII